MRNPRTVTVTTSLIFILIIGIASLLIGSQIGIWKGRILGYEEANSQNQRMAFSRAKTLAEAAYRGELNENKERCKRWVDGLGRDLKEARSIIRGYQG